MNAESPAWSPWHRRLLFVAVWTLLAVLSSVEAYFSQATMGPPITWGVAFRRSFEQWYAWGIVAVGVIWLGNRFPYRRGQGGRWAVLHFCAAIAAAVVSLAFYSWLLKGQVSVQDGSILEFGKVFKKMLIHYMVFQLIVYWLVLLGHHGWHYYQRFRERELQAAELEHQLAEARLASLRMQLNPHFLFNTLHTISALIVRRPEDADRVVARLSELLRLSLDQSHQHEVPLREELAFLDRYLAIEQIRFQDRLTVIRDIESGLANALVPSLILQPLVENAIRHGIESRESGGRIELGAHRVGDLLELRVCDNGPGMDPHGSPAVREGIGLANTRSRLQHLYGTNQRLEIVNGSAGLQVRVTLPYHVEESQPSAADSHAS